MKKTIRHTSASLALMGAIIGTSWSSESYAFCTMPSDYSARAIGYALGQTAVDEYFDHEFRDHYRLVNDAGWDLIPTDLTGHDTNERTKFVLASYLVWTGIVGDTPQVAQTEIHPILGLGWGYDPNALRISPAFHRSADEWGPLTSDFTVPLCTKINFFTGERFCGSEGTATFDDLIGVAAHDAQLSTLVEQQQHFMGILGYTSGFYDGRVTWGKPTITGIDDVSSRGFRAQFQTKSVPILSPNANYQITYFCNAFQSTTPDLAATIIHENWHGTHAPWHTGYSNLFDPTDSQECDTVKGCDAFIWSEPTSHSFRWEERGLRQLNTGAFQIEQRYLCDLATGAANWVPWVLSETAATDFKDESDSQRFTNTPGNLSPYTCEPPPLPVPTTCETCAIRDDCASPIDYVCSDGCCSLAIR